MRAKRGKQAEQQPGARPEFDPKAGGFHGPSALRRLTTDGLSPSIMASSGRRSTGSAATAIRVTRFLTTKSWISFPRRMAFSQPRALRT